MNIVALGLTLILLRLTYAPFLLLYMLFCWIMFMLLKIDCKPLLRGLLIVLPSALFSNNPWAALVAGCVIPMVILIHFRPRRLSQYLSVYQVIALLIFGIVVAFV